MSQLFKQNEAVETAALQEEWILFHPQQNKFCMLNKTSGFIWARLKTPATVEEVASALAKEFSGVSSEQALEDTRKVLENFISLDLARAAVPDTLTT